MKLAKLCNGLARALLLTVLAAPMLVACTADEVVPVPVAATDTDGDGVPDRTDNCPLVANPAQTDSNGNGIGDDCETDFDGDGVDDVNDNCPSIPNPDQDDTDSNGIGDACEAGSGITDDDDGDGIAGTSAGGPDNCPAIYNPGQEDSNGDGVGDACDTPISRICGDGFRPLLDREATPFASAPTRVLGITLSEVRDIAALTDDDAGNSTKLRVYVDALGLLGRAHAGIRLATPQPGNRETGFVVSTPAAVLSLSLLTGLSVETLSGAQVVETFDDSSLLGLSLLAGSTDKGVLTFTPTQPYDAVRLRMGGAVDVLASVNLHAACRAY